MDKTIDCLGEMCPIPILRLRKELLRAKPGERIKLVTDHSCVPVSIGEYCSKQGLAYEVLEAANGIWEITIILSP